jgi:hypothetical protein
MAKTPPHATGLHSARASETRSPISCCAARILSAEARRRPRTSLASTAMRSCTLPHRYFMKEDWTDCYGAFRNHLLVRRRRTVDSRYSRRHRQPVLHWQSGRKKLEAPSSPGLHRRRAACLSSSDCRQRSLANRALAVLSFGVAPTGARYQATVYKASSRASHNVNLNNGSECAVTARLHTTKRVGRRSLPASLPIPLVDVEERNGSAPDYSGQIRAKF